MEFVKQLFCKHRLKLLFWDERVVYKTEKTRLCEFYFQCEKCFKRINIKSNVDITLFKTEKELI